MRDAARKSPQRAAALPVLDAEFLADPSGALFWPSENLLVVADLHLEKGSAFAVRGVFLPPYDTAATLAALGNLIGLYQPRRVVALGDSFHDGGAGERLDSGDRRTLATLQRGRDWIWIAGNHDPAPPAGLAGEARGELAIGSILFRHEPSAARGRGEIAGHLHPAAKLSGRGGSVRGRSFVSDGSRCVLPAFGAFAGGLNVRDAAFDALFDGEAGKPVLAHVIGRSAVYAVPHRLCLPD
ncbi:ligase-associated DNA damage response endonuclease PdeM [Methylocella silvestris]|uniref:Phosphoesterase n=1 Tax=Methylocella silvestris TaxID=199596 RepID=A0A2J7TJL0_METSI|nr:ligase-associated DNA damage response endonuclease PdeM [Methylocella silvestris]PNG26946.1 phosphoesterase [Methylocella silvestris]